ncbi:MAG: methyltransferase [archaeon]
MNKTQFFSQKTNTFYQILPTKTIPVLRINGVPMHRFATLDPLTDTLCKIRSARPFGRVLDICTGLGYTAIQSARRQEVKEVITIEMDSEVIELCKLNEASVELFNNPKIKIINKDATEAILDFKDKEFDCIIHDPPTFKMAPALYHADFYKHLYRILKHNGRLWHYAPEPGKLKGTSAKFVGGIIKRLKETGFRELKHDQESCGIVCKK